MRKAFFFFSLLSAAAAQNRANLDQFSYGETDRSGVNNIYGPEDWDRVRCADLDQCLGWPDGWELGVEWELPVESACRDCSADTCDRHHQSPINLERNRAIIGHPDYNECIDKHWMAYKDSSCTFQRLKEKNAFSIERHALKITQPVHQLGDDEYELDCRGNRWGKIDFSKGFSNWWFLSHIDFHVPSEHTQEGKRYSGEIQMYHFYSVSGEEAGADNEMASVTIFLEAYNNSPDYDFLNRIICAWRATEEETREQCDLPSVYDEYPGCFYYRRGHNLTDADAETKSLADGVRRNLRQTKTAPPRPKAMSAHDIIMHNYGQEQNNATYKPRKIVMDKANFEADTDFDWDAFITSQYEEEEAAKNRRRLLNYDHVGPWFNYFAMLGCRTEYYYRYEGTQTVPPCYSRERPNNNRGETNHWRVLKDPIRVSHRQIDELHRLLKKRIAPVDDPLRRCQPDTAAKPHPDDPGKIWVARPLQTNHRAHAKVFCECQDWGSKWKEDREWCAIRNQTARYYDHPYNFESSDF